MNKNIKLCLSCLPFLLLSACGGGDASNAGTRPEPVVIAAPNTVPTANAGPDQTVIVGATVVLDGAASADRDGDPLAYKWAMSSMPPDSKATLPGGTSSMRPTLLPDAAGLYVISLVVNDGKADSASAKMTVTVLPRQVAVNAAPVANAGANQTVPVGTKVTLSGAASSDENGDTLQYRWRLQAKPAGSNADVWGNATVQPTITVDVPGSYILTLVVGDGKAESAQASVTVNAFARGTSANGAPIAHAGVDQTVSVGATVTVDASKSTDPDRDPLAYTWSMTGKPFGSAALISAPASAAPIFVADVSGIYQLTLSVNDGKVSGPVTDVIHVVAMSANAAVIADTGTYKCASLTSQSALLLYSQGHTYLDRDHDGRPCEANDIANEIAFPYSGGTTTTGSQCYVRGYYRKNGTYVSGYYRRCS